MRIYDRLLHMVRLLLAVTVRRGAARLEADTHDRPEAAALALPPPDEVDTARIVFARTSSGLIAIGELETADTAPTEAAPEPLVVVTIPDADSAPDPVEPLEIDKDGWLVGVKVVRVPTVRTQRLRSASGKPLGILWHWTATAHGTALTMARRIAKGSGSSVHLWIEHDGTLYQSAPLTRGTGHAGGDTSARVKEVRGEVVRDPRSPLSVNSFLLGIELVCVGEVRLVGGRWLGWPFGKDTPTRRSPVVPADQVMPCRDGAGRLRHYQGYTEAQLRAAERFTVACRNRYGLTRKQCSWGHEDVDPTRKSDPGHWRRDPMAYPSVLDRVYGR
jgi:N-acetyl-anhydromuramyl-L-alanine amidase AmpD